MAPYQNISVFDQPQDTSVNPEDVKSVGKFETTGIDGKTYTEKVFSDYDLTLVNIFYNLVLTMCKRDSGTSGAL